jgi:ribosomal protein S18 acetylase RimI-like enzyme
MTPQYSSLRSGDAARRDHCYTRTNMRITKLTEPQLDEAAALLARAFFDSPVWTWVVPDETQRRTAMAWFMSAAVRYGMLGGEAYGAGAPLRGVAIWDRPSDGIDMDPDGTKSGFHEISSRMGEYVMARFAAMSASSAVREQAMGGQPHWYLSLLAADPASQRTGAGTAVLADMFTRLDAAGLPCCTETSNEVNVAYYERHGFVVVGEGTFPLDGPRFWIMRRDPPS